MEMQRLLLLLVDTLHQLVALWVTLILLKLGMVQVGLSFSDALQTYTVLTIGDGLVGQLPALIVSGAAGLLITRVSPEDEAEELANQTADESTRPQAINRSPDQPDLPPSKSKWVLGSASRGRLA